jgi:D-glycero-D-manno-heptose 1,7-bisphosphate phosphatase
MNKAAFLDRDGVINQSAPEGDYILRWEDFHLLPGVIEAISLLNRSDYLVMVVTNQRCVSRGLLTIPALEDIHQKMSAQLLASGARIDAIYYCPHAAEPPCTCRKPLPGMLLSAAKDYNIALSNSWMIGDTDSDMEAGKCAGCRTIRITKYSSAAVSASVQSAESLLAAVRKVLALPLSPNHD